MERKGTVIRCIDHLDISAEAKHLATELVAQIDMPIVFLIDHDLDKQYASRSQVHHNQFWVLANHQQEQSEYERILLSNIYRGLQTRKRLLHPIPSIEYENSLNQIKNHKLQVEHRNLYYELLRKISALVTTIDAEQFLKPKGFEVSEKQKQWLYSNRISLLDEYLEIQRQRPLFSWHWEVEYMNILDYSRIALFHPDFYQGIVSRLKKIRPISAANRCINRLSLMISMIKTAEKKYNSDPQEDVANWMTQEIINIMQIDNMLILDCEYVLSGCFYFKDGSHADIYSFIPDDFQNHDIMIKGLRYVNEGILLLQEYYATFSNRNLPDIHANLIYSSRQNAYANVLADNSYISITSGILSEIMNSMPEEINNVPLQYLKMIGEQEACRRLEKYAIFYITAHEYAHIINGDCMEAEHYQDTWDLINKRETAADNFARNTLKKILLFQYRPDMNTSLSSRVREMQINHSVDSILLEISCRWCDQYFLRLTSDA